METKLNYGPLFRLASAASGSWPDSSSIGQAADVVGASGAVTAVTASTSAVVSARHPLEGIQELPENVSDNGSIAEAAAASSAFMPVSSKGTDDNASPILGQVATFTT